MKPPGSAEQQIYGYNDSVAGSERNFIQIMAMKEEIPVSEVDPKLMEMADVFHIPLKERLKYIILPAKLGMGGRQASGKPGKDDGRKASSNSESSKSD